MAGGTMSGVSMRTVMIVGVLLIAAGLYVLIGSPSYSEDKSLFKIGSVEAKVTERHTIPGWGGALGLAAGLVLVVVGARRR